MCLKMINGIKEFVTKDDTGNFCSLQISDGSYIVACKNLLIMKFNKNHVLQAYATRIDDLFKELVIKIVLSNAENKFAIATGSHHIWIFETKTMKACFAFNGHHWRIEQMYFSENDKILITKDYRGNTIELDAETGERLKTNWVDTY